MHHFPNNGVDAANNGGNVLMRGEIVTICHTGILASLAGGSSETSSQPRKDFLEGRILNISWKSGLQEAFTQFSQDQKHRTVGVRDGGCRKRHFG